MAGVPFLFAKTRTEDTRCPDTSPGMNVIRLNEPFHRVCHRWLLHAAWGAQRSAVNHRVTPNGPDKGSARKALQRALNYASGKDTQLNFQGNSGRRDWTRTNDPHHVKVVL